MNIHSNKNKTNIKLNTSFTPILTMLSLSNYYTDLL